MTTLSAAPDAPFMPRSGATRGHTLLAGLMVALLVGAFLASTAMVVACAGPSICQDGGAIAHMAPAGYGLRG